MPRGERTCRFCGRAVTFDTVLYVWFDRAANGICVLAPEGQSRHSPETH